MRLYLRNYMLGIEQLKVPTVSSNINMRVLVDFLILLN